MGRILIAALALGMMPASHIAWAEEPERRPMEAILHAQDHALSNLDEEDLALIQDMTESVSKPDLSSADSQAIEEIAQALPQQAAEATPLAAEAMGASPDVIEQLNRALGVDGYRERHPDEQPLPVGRQIYVLVSQSMPEAELVQVATTLPENGYMILRGLMEFQTLPDLGRLVNTWVDDPTTLGQVQIDPTVFQDLGVEDVPAVAIRENGEWLGIIYGTTNPDGLVERLAQGENGDLGQIGPTVSIIEQDLLHRMETEMAARLEEKAVTATESYLENVELFALNPAREYRTRLIDPSIRVQHDLVLPDGTVLARAGDMLNPLEGRGFQSRLIIIDALSDDQVELARNLASISMERMNVMVLVSNLDRLAGWEGYHGMVATVNHPIFLLTDEVRSRFGVTHAPTIIDGEGYMVRVREWPVDTDPAWLDGEPQPLAGPADDEVGEGG